MDFTELLDAFSAGDPDIPDYLRNQINALVQAGYTPTKTGFDGVDPYAGRTELTWRPSGDQGFEFDSDDGRFYSSHEVRLPTDYTKEELAALPTNPDNVLPYQDSSSPNILESDGWGVTPFKSAKEALDFLQANQYLQDTDTWEFYGQKPEFSFLQPTEEGKKGFFDAWNKEDATARQLAEAEGRSAIPPMHRDDAYGGDVDLSGKYYDQFITSTKEAAPYADYAFARTLLQQGWKLVDGEHIAAPDGSILTLTGRRQPYERDGKLSATHWKDDAFNDMVTSVNKNMRYDKNWDDWYPFFYEDADGIIPSHLLLDDGWSGKYGTPSKYFQFLNVDRESPLPEGTLWRDTVFGKKANFLNPNSPQWKRAIDANIEHAGPVNWLTPKGALLAGNRGGKLRKGVLPNGPVNVKRSGLVSNLVKGMPK